MPPSSGRSDLGRSLADGLGYAILRVHCSHPARRILQKTQSGVGVLDDGHGPAVLMHGVGESIGDSHVFLSMSSDKRHQDTC